ALPKCRSPRRSATLGMRAEGGWSARADGISTVERWCVFDQKTCESLGFYVYALFDPATPRMPFYIGKGVNNRVFGHAAGELQSESEDDALGPKLEKIREIRQRGNQVVHKIVRWRLSEEEAF